MAGHEPALKPLIPNRPNSRDRKTLKEDASGRQDIRPFTEFLAQLLDRELKGETVARLPKA